MLRRQGISAVAGLPVRGSTLWKDLPQVLPGVIGEDADDASGHDGCGDAKYPNEGCYLIDFADDLRLNLLFMGDSLAKKQLVFLIAGELSLVGE
jgi:hypothetical protein